MSITYEQLGRPLMVGPYELRNRIIMAPMETNYGSAFGEPTPRLVAYLSERAKGGTAMIIVEYSCVKWPQGKGAGNELRIDEDKFITQLHDLARGIKENGAVACIQIHHAGRFADYSEPVSASDVPSPALTGGIAQPRPLTIPEIQEIEECYAKAAVRAKMAGFDMVELHGATGYLLTQFISPHTNRRTDMYGGAFENRIRMPLEIIEKIHKYCGNDFPIGFRMLGEEWLPNGIHIDEAKALAQALERNGVSYVSITAGTYESMPIGEGFLAMRSPKGICVPYSEQIKKVVQIPVFVNGNISHPDMMEMIISEGKADAVVLARPLVADPYLAKKTLSHNVEDVRKCTNCSSCLDSVNHGWGVECAQNPFAGRERELIIVKTEKPKKVLVIGGGVGGMQAALLAAERGHAVTLWEKNNELGGQMLYASMPIGKNLLNDYTVAWFKHQLKKSTVQVVLEKEASLELISQFAPDAVIVAIGAKPLIPPIPGIDNKSVVLASSVLDGTAQVGKKVVVCGGGQVGVEVADFIAERGLSDDITIIEMLYDVALDMDFMNRIYLMQKLYQYGVKIICNTKIQEFKEGSVVGIDKNWQLSEYPADTCVLALGYTADRSLYEQLKKKGIEVYAIGDCVQPRKEKEAIHEGALIGLSI